MFVESGQDPFTLGARPVQIIIGERCLESFVAQELLHTFSREQVLFHALSHEAYHSNEGQHLQQMHVPRHLFDQMFSASIRPGFSSKINDPLVNMASIVWSFNNGQDQPETGPIHAERIERLTRLHTKINEGAADVYGLSVYGRMYPDSAITFAKALYEARRLEREQMDLSPDLNVKAGTYDNASCLKSFFETPYESWPKDQKSCTVFALRHAVPYFRQEPEFLAMSQVFDGMAEELDHFSGLSFETRFVDGPVSRQGITPTPSALTAPGHRYRRRR